MICHGGECRGNERVGIEMIWKTIRPWRGVPRRWTRTLGPWCFDSALRNVLRATSWRADRPSAAPPLPASVPSDYNFDIGGVETWRGATECGAIKKLRILLPAGPAGDDFGLHLFDHEIHPLTARINLSLIYSTMTSYNGRCHCGQTEWTAKLADAGHILW